MKYLIASDVHGSEACLKKLLDRFEKEKADKLILCGDIYNHGPRNPFPQEYAPMAVAEALNAIKDKLIVIKGNCDSEVDAMISEFDFILSVVIIVNNKSIFLTHGHVYNKDAMPKTGYDAVIYGHFHTGFIEQKGDCVVANAGSISLPKNGFSKSYLLLDEDLLTLKTLEGETIKETKI